MRHFLRAGVLALTSALAAVTATTGAAMAASPSAPGAPSEVQVRADCRSDGTAFGDKLLPGHCLRNGGYRLEMQYDGNLVLYSGSRACWASGTDGTDGVYAEYSGDWQIDSPFMTLESPFGELRKWRGKYTGLHKTGDVSLNNKGEVWIAYGKFVNC
ncbi:hypothetical protein LO772_04955 [Yinghuangia sp. ASG 101]|uniref:hypothetical protein n=1 Tax=Yinghuangia sp. ASG 101 TaxID=2896848 RepID=UPI001E4DC229|nr:hypothetical protein [Yinghuangia sp. ASG 101]UGQ12974.1 hypothetical protein LO772_04955 [Yinghuangia sp. ASG 101]